MSMVFEKLTERDSTGNTHYVITRIDGINPRNCLPKEYLNKEDRLFRITAKKNSRNGTPRFVSGVVILHDKDNFETEVIKIFPGKRFEEPEWRRILGIVKNAGNRLHEIRRSKRSQNYQCTDII